MSKQSVQQVIVAESHADAFAKSRWSERYGKTGYYPVRDTFEDVFGEIEVKRMRAQTNPDIYANKLEEYEQMTAMLLAMRKSDEADPKVVAAGMLAHGDVRVDQPEKCCVAELDPGKLYLVFGYTFG